MQLKGHPRGGGLAVRSVTRQRRAGPRRYDERDSGKGRIEEDKDADFPAFENGIRQIGMETFHYPDYV